VDNEAEIGDSKSEGMFLRTRRGVPDGKEERCEEPKKDGRNILTPAGLVFGL
jgi:hypothetical protein